ncbi:isoleucyl-tRNA synthetase [Arsukibacterium sp. MJ3]|uniref:alkaline phosphatase D family protein n=1 Tax=Arsukibacterium sp. MJ3 TaxID=1632859 RepID=UPI0006272057|nr:alkaline phosphatase D family protein [Arsukibacterium sp. MJ3]KKO50266.1 isoleucyl-tRNA synthetase [Arsukibacterium sp. MJ3]
MTRPDVSTTIPDDTLPLVLAGPLLRAVTANSVTLWLATSKPVQLQLQLSHGSYETHHFSAADMQQHCQSVRCAGKLFLQLIHIRLSSPLPTGCWIEYDLRLAGQHDDEQPDGEPPEWLGWQHWAPDLVYAGRNNPGFVIQPKLQRLLHGSCRKPHFDTDDGLLAADLYLQQQPPEQWPSLLLLSGDQIYADDVAAPMLRAIHQLITQLDFADESLPCSKVSQSAVLHQHSPHYFQRDTLLPQTAASQAVLTQVFKGAKKPVFTSDSARNHLISLAEMLGMYLLVWSPAGWQDQATELSNELTATLSATEQQTYTAQQHIIQQFAAGLSKVRRLLAHLPSAMIFDDHDVTDDWNLTAEWEQTAYNHDFSRRIIGNALIGYLLCQGWGNTPEQFNDGLLQQAELAMTNSGSAQHQQLITELLRYKQWHYKWPTEPPLLVLDTRTRRWRSELALDNPSGLLDWEALSELQQDLIGHDAVVLVSPAPVFGVKLIEGIQKIFTLFGRPLLVDAENWMAHRGTAYALMNLFRHPKTPKHFVILSGDVHYSFVYEVHLRGRQRGPDIWQITSSGLKNEFPPRLLNVLDRLNRWLYSPRSPLNWFTKRRQMKIVPHKPDNAKAGERLLNMAGIGLVELNSDGSPKRVVQLGVKGQAIAFNISEDDARWE